MKIYLSLLLILFLFSCDSTKNTINDKSKRNENWCWKINPKTKKGTWIKLGTNKNDLTGLYTLFYKTGEIREKGTFKNGENVDSIFIYNQNNQVVKINYGFESNDLITAYFPINGLIKIKHSNLTISEKGIVKNHLREGLWKQYTRDGVLIRKSTFKKGELNGYYYEWNQKGQLIEKSFWIKGKTESPYYLYHSNGKLKESAKFINGKREGLCYSYYESGKLKSKNNYRNDLLNGKSLKRNENGSLEFEIHFINGIKDGAFIHYHKNGNISQKGTLINGKLNGDIYFYKENGKLFQVDYYEDNQLVRIEKK